MYDYGGKFRSRTFIDNIFIPIFYYVPMVLFGSSIYNLDMSGYKNFYEKILIRFLPIMIGVIWIFEFYPCCACFCFRYFDELNTGNYIDISNDFRLEFLISLLYVLYVFSKKTIKMLKDNQKIDL